MKTILARGIAGAFICLILGGYLLHIFLPRPECPWFTAYLGDKNGKHTWVCFGEWKGKNTFYPVSDMKIKSGRHYAFKWLAVGSEGLCWDWETFFLAPSGKIVHICGTPVKYCPRTGKGLRDNLPFNFFLAKAN